MDFAAVSANSVPWLTERQGVSAQVVRELIQTARINTQGGQVPTASVNSLVFQPVGANPSFDTDSGVDAFDRNARVRNSFREFYGNVLTSIREHTPGWRPPFREMGPMASGQPTSFGSRPNDQFGGFPHAPGEAPGNVSPSARRRKHKARPLSSQEQEVRQHSGISCQAAHGVTPHRIWVDWCDSTGY